MREQRRESTFRQWKKYREGKDAGMETLTHSSVVYIDTFLIPLCNGTEVSDDKTLLLI